MENSKLQIHGGSDAPLEMASDAPERVSCVPPSARPVISVDELRKLVRVDEATGLLYWRVRINQRQRAGDLAGGFKEGYRHLTIHRRFYKAHRVVFALTRGRWPADLIDHINGDGLDNRPENLREANRAQNNHNSRTKQSKAHPCRGVYWVPRLNRWLARIKVGRRVIELGTHVEREDAAMARLWASHWFHGEFAAHLSRPERPADGSLGQ